MPKLTKTLVDNTKAPTVGDAWVWDSELEGFGIRIQKSGRKTYVVRYRARNGSRTQRKLTICPCSHMPPEKARESARKVFAQVADGFDPAEGRKIAKASTATVKVMFEAYVASLRKRGRISAGDVELALLRSKVNAADALGRDRLACEVTPAMVVQHVASYFNRGRRASADKVRSYISSAFGWAMKSTNDYMSAERFDWNLTINPAAHIAKDSEPTKARNRNLTMEELAVLWKATDAGNGGFSIEVASCIKMLICCGQRVLETLRMEGSEIDLEAALWRMPKEKTKGRKHAHTIPLPRQAIPVLKALIERHGNGFLFKGYRVDKPCGYSSVNNAIGYWLAQGEPLEHFQSRDLRRTWKSRTHDAGVDRYTRDLIQQHAKNDTGSKHYDRADYLPQMREAMEKWSVLLDECLPEPSVVPGTFWPVHTDQQLGLN